MKRFISLIAVTAILLSCTGCGEEKAQETVEEWGDTATSEVVVEPTLYTIGDAFSRVFDALGYDAEKSPAENRALIDEALSQYGHSVTSLKSAFTGNPNTDPSISTILSLAGISNEEVDWTSVITYVALPILSEDAINVAMPDDREQFLKNIKDTGIAAYESVIDLVPIEARFSKSVIDTFLNAEACDNFMTREASKLKVVNEYTIQYNEGLDLSFYELVLYNGIRMASYYPTLVNEDERPLYMREKVSDSSDVELWQVYTVYFLKMLEENYHVSSSEGVIDKTEDGIAIWWSLGNSKTLSLTIGESGFICVSVSTDDRFVEYNGSQIGPSTTVKLFDNEMITLMQNNYGLSNADIEQLSYLCEVLVDNPITIDTSVCDRLASCYIGRGDTYLSNFTAYSTMAGILDTSIDMSLYEVWFDKIPAERIYAGADECILKTEFALLHTPSKRLKIAPFNISSDADKSNVASYGEINRDMAIGGAITKLGRSTTLWSASVAYLSSMGESAFTTLNDLGETKLRQLFEAVPYFTSDEQEVLLGALDN